MTYEEAYLLPAFAQIGSGYPDSEERQNSSRSEIRDIREPGFILDTLKAVTKKTFAGFKE